MSGSGLEDRGAHYTQALPSCFSTIAAHLNTSSSDSAFPVDPSAWHRRVWRRAGPSILSNISVPLVGAVDTAVVGHLPDPVYIGAVAIGALIFSFLFYGFGFLRMGTTGLVAQAHGAEDATGVALVLVRALLMAGAFGLVLIIFQHPLSLVSFWLLDGGEQLESLADEYFRVRVGSAPATLGN